MRSTAGGHFEQAIKKYMEELGYIVSVKLVNAAEYGVPQVRQRLLFVGVLSNSEMTKPYVFPEGLFKGRFRTVKDAIFDLPVLGNNESVDQYATAPLNDYQRLMRGFGNISAIDNTSKLYNHVAPNHPRETVDRIAATPQGQPMYPKFKQRIRLRLDAPSPTQLAGGIRPQFQFGHPTQPRGLSIRERARIQSFPDSYVFEGGTVQERVQTGNAVPPLLIYNIVKPIAEDINKHKGE
jgi:DNA (cytosine-5)-methyltransferase 1